MVDELNQAKTNLENEKQRSNELEAQANKLSSQKSILEDEMDILKKNVSLYVYTYISLMYI